MYRLIYGVEIPLLIDSAFLIGTNSYLLTKGNIFLVVVGYAGNITLTITEVFNEEMRVVISKIMNNNGGKSELSVL